ncbi:MAG TPA: lysophospholipid acyltransferase family protein [Actinomycetota bacterium]|nr:lysophospholipid acyltransferase family protein [Actinomycetota bacterium]
MSLREELKVMRDGFRWGRRTIVPRSAEPFVEEADDEGFPTDWARTRAGTAVRQAILQTGMGPLVRSQVALRVYGLEALDDVEGPVIFFSNHGSHLDATLIMTALPERWQRKTAVGAARDYFFDVWWRQAFTALVYGGFAIDRARGGTGAIDKARELVRDGWSLVLFPEGTRSPDGHLQRFRHGASRLALELGVGVAPIAIVGAYQAMPKGKLWPRPGRPPVTMRFGNVLYPHEGETHQSLSIRMQQAVSELFDEDRTTWFEAVSRSARNETPSIAGPLGAAPWRRTWEGTRPVPRRGRPSIWE